MSQALRKEDVRADPIEQFGVWWEEALETEVIDPNAMTLATVTPGCRPSARIVLLKGFDEHGFVFYTNYRSQKGQELEAHPCAALVFWWNELNRQVRVDGNVTKIDPETSAAYFQSRPRGSQLGAWASAQSAVLDSREVLQQQLREAKATFQGREVPCPEHWGGYRVAPVAVEFWQGRPNRLHDRIRYRKTEEGAWTLERLAP